MDVARPIRQRLVLGGADVGEVLRAWGQQCQCRIIGSAVVAWRAAPQVPNLAGEAHTTVRRARGRRDLELPAMEITAAEQHLDERRRRQEQFRAIADGD